MQIVLSGVGVLLVVATFVPLIPSSERWIRVFDFPRLQIAVLILVVLAGHGFFLPAVGAPELAVVGALIAALGWQSLRILPYTPLMPSPVRRSRSAGGRPRLRIVIANVRMENRNAEALLGILDDVAPDLVLLVETDDWWDRAMKPLAARLPHAVRQPQDNFYGMLLYSTHAFESASVEFLVDDYIPSIHVTIKLQTGERVDFYGLHPVPPPLADTAQRDAELLIAGRMARDSAMPAIVAGDLNDVGWSTTTRLFMRISGLLDPRRGRGLYASYNANNPLLRWPLDYIFHDPVFTLREMRLLEDFGSDHFPVFVELCHAPEAEHLQEEPEPEPGDRAEAAETIEEGLDHEPEPGDYPRKG